jgi:hypothetical protein
MQEYQQANTGVRKQVKYLMMAQWADTCWKNDECMVYPYFLLWWQNKIKEFRTHYATQKYSIPCTYLEGMRNTEYEPEILLTLPQCSMQ